MVPGTFPEHDDMRSTCTQLIKVLGNQRRLDLFVERAAADPATAAYHERFQELRGPGAIVRHPVAPAPAWHTADLSARQEQRLLEKRSRLNRIELATWVAEAAGSVAMLTLRFGPGRARAFGTGFLIADDLLLTARHNLNPQDNGRMTGATANFDHDQQYRDEPLVRTAVPEPVAQDRLGDWAVLRLTEPTGRRPLVLGSAFAPCVDDPLVIIQHPLGAAKQFALEPFAVTHVDEQHLEYVADTQAGSSGSPVCNERMEVVAVHLAEAEVKVTVHGSVQTAWRNQGVRIEPVMRALK